MSQQKYCTTCGAPLIEGKAFCTSCGAPVTAGDPQQTTAPSLPITNTSNQINSDVSQTNKAKKKPVGLIVVLIVVLLAVVAVVALFASGVIRIDQSSDATETVIPTELDEASVDEDEASEPKSDASDDAMVSTAEREEVEERERKEAPVDPNALDLSDEEDAFLVNKYLSNFTEIGNLFQQYDASNTATAQRYVFAFALVYTELNDPSAILPTDEPEYEAHANSRIPVSVLNEYAETYLKTSISENTFNNYSRCVNGYVYTSVSDDRVPWGIAKATNLVPINDKEYLVQFDIYGGSPAVGNGFPEPQGYDLTNENYYRMPEDELRDEFGLPAQTGQAIIETGYDDEVAPFKLITFVMFL
ncbi:zinc-ribbon domain-containing protein [Adlercreutzia agrestimuris]|uniref:zinc-ribbon domain-containing protein n=1 Tax=Adlercreutzia agrestimuris TaxID=2941324 RepID=UPI00204011E4|nr:zinc-ribbon domain-containing protein [Adlercreutzia agrestimuris]